SPSVKRKATLLDDDADVGDGKLAAQSAKGLIADAQVMRSRRHALSRGGGERKRRPVLHPFDLEVGQFEDRQLRPFFDACLAVLVGRGQHGDEDAVASALAARAKSVVPQ